MLIKGMLGMASPAGPCGRLSILIFHRVLPEQDPLFPLEMHAHRFDELCGWMRSFFNVLPLDQAVQQLGAGTLPSRAACITFDDGYADNHDLALPVLQRHQLPATFFITTGFLDGGRMWNDTVIESIRRSPLASIDAPGMGPLTIATVAQKRAAIESVIGQIKYLPVADRLAFTERLAEAAGVRPPDDLMMSSEQVRALRRAGMQIGAHTVSHPILARLGEQEAGAEIRASKDCLERLLGERVGLFAYPNGKPGEDYSELSVGLVRQLGFDAAVSTHWGAADASSDRFQLPRFTPWDQSRLRFGARMWVNLRSRVKALPPAPITPATP